MLVGGLPYVTAAQLPLYGPQAALNLASSPQATQACLDASELADGFMRGRFPMPLVAVGNDIVRYTAYIAWALIMGTVGFAVQGADVNIIRNDLSARGGTDPKTGARVIGWFEKVQRQEVQPDVTLSTPSGSDPGHDAPQVMSQPLRGWQQVNRCGKPVVGGF